jgi:hypothetical protein
MNLPHILKPGLLAPLLAALLLTACNQTSWPDHDSTVVDNVGADSVKAWPPGARFALPGDNVLAQVHGLRRVYECASVLEFGWTALDSSGAAYLAPHARVELPSLPDCALSKGLDTVLDTSAPAAGKHLYFRTPAGAVTDSVLSVAGSGAVEAFLHPPGDTLRAHDRFTFYDSTAGHPRRSLYSDSLEACEIVQGATYSRLHGGDTLSVRFRTLLAAPLDTAVFPACAGPHSDTVDVVPDLYGYP